MLADVIGDRRLIGENGACRIARLIEEQLIAKGWPQGLSCGSELGLARDFGVGRAVIREAVKILEVRGTALMVRGPRGGLRALKIDPRHATDFIIGFGFFTGVTEAQIGEAQEVLCRARANLEKEGDCGDRARSGSMAALDFCDNIIGRLREAIVCGDGSAVYPSVLFASDMLHRSRAGEIVGRILRECTSTQWMQGHRLGSEEDLCFRFDVDRDALRQAVRILESVGAAEANCGRGHGLVSQAPNCGAVARLASCFFASSNFDPQAVAQVFHSLSVELVALAATKAAPADCEAADRLLEQLEEALKRRDTESIFAGIFAVEKAIVSVAANPVLQLLIRSLGGYPATCIPRNPALLEAMNRSFLKHSRPILQAFRVNDSLAAAAAERIRADRLSAFLAPFKARMERHRSAA